MTQSTRRTIVCIAGCALVAALAGCSMSSLTSGIGGGWFGGGEKAKTEVATVSEDQLLAAAKTDAVTTGSIGLDVAHGCPRFQVWSREGYVTIYEPGKVGDGLAVMHCGEIPRPRASARWSPAASPSSTASLGVSCWGRRAGRAA